MQKARKKLGIVGGMGSHAGAWLFERIIQLSPAQADQDYPEILFHNNSPVPDRTQAILSGSPGPVHQLAKSVELFNHYRVDVAVLACMTAYFYYGKLAELFHGKIINPLELTARELLHGDKFSGAKCIGLIGSTGLLRTRLYHEKLEGLGYKVVTLNEGEQQQYFTEPVYGKNGLKAGGVTEAVRDTFLAQVPLLAGKGADVVVGACSEVPLVVGHASAIAFPFLNVFEVLAQRTVDYCYSKEN
ncbi:MAG: aspartate/glutamate racemase family protein [Cytophagales bacterium]|nr:aspartate/glutamate racemase family protein [Cytophagales bacterium]